MVMSTTQAVTTVTETVKYQEVAITPCASGFGLYEASTEGSDIYDDASDLRDDMATGCDEQGSDLIELTDEAELPAGVEDIRGRIHNEPMRVFAAIHEYGVYLGIRTVKAVA